MSELDPILLSEEQMNRVKELEAMNRTDRRKIAKRMKMPVNAIPGSSKPIYGKNSN